MLFDLIFEIFNSLDPKQVHEFILRYLYNFSLKDEKLETSSFVQEIEKLMNKL
jgi:hypothetical protein